MLNYIGVHIFSTLPAFRLIYPQTNIRNLPYKYIVVVKDWRDPGLAVICQGRPFVASAT